MATGTQPERERRPVLEASDAGKLVVTTDGDVIGTVERVRGERAYIAPDPGVLAGLGCWLTQPWRGEKVFQLDRRLVEEVNENAVVVKATG